ADPPQAGEQAGVAPPADGGEDAAHPHHEHDRVADHEPGPELAEAVDRGDLQDGRVEQRGLAGPAPPFGGLGVGPPGGGLCEGLGHRASYRPRCSTMGPSASAGKNVRPTTITTTPTNRATNSG